MGKIHTLRCRSHEKLWESDGKSDWQQKHGEIQRRGLPVFRTQPQDLHCCCSDPWPWIVVEIEKDWEPSSELAVSYRLQNHPILSSSIYLLKSPRCPCYFAFHAFTTWSDQQWVDRFCLIGGNLYLHEHNKYLSGSKEGCVRRIPLLSCMIKCYRLFDCNITRFSAKTAFPCSRAFTLLFIL